MSADTVTMTAPDATALILRAYKDGKAIGAMRKKKTVA